MALHYGLFRCIPVAKRTPKGTERYLDTLRRDEALKVAGSLPNNGVGKFTVRLGPLSYQYPYSRLWLMQVHTVWECHWKAHLAAHPAEKVEVDEYLAPLWSRRTYSEPLVPRHALYGGCLVIRGCCVLILWIEGRTEVFSHFTNVRTSTDPLLRDGKINYDDVVLAPYSHIYPHPRFQ